MQKLLRLGKPMHIIENKLDADAAAVSKHFIIKQSRAAMQRTQASFRFVVDTQPKICAGLFRLEEAEVLAGSVRRNVNHGLDFIGGCPQALGNHGIIIDHQAGDLVRNVHAAAHFLCRVLGDLQNPSHDIIVKLISICNTDAFYFCISGDASKTGPSLYCGKAAGIQIKGINLGGKHGLYVVV